MADSLRGDGLARAQRALAGLERDPQRLDYARTRFDDSPPPYTSEQSGTTTRSQSLNPLGEEQQRREERLIQLGLDAEASAPHEQFSAQVDEERRRIWNADPRTSWRSMPPGDTLEKEASETIKMRWVEQGIWNSKWNQFAFGRWKHEEPLELESESESDSEARPTPVFTLFPKPQLKPRQPKTDDEKRQIAQRRVIREREREASRPYHQFIYQITKERERIQEQRNGGEIADAVDINTQAYENVKNTWANRKIWNSRWGILPGMSWKHEHPIEEQVVDHGPAPVPANPPANGNHGGIEASAIRLFGPPSPTQSNHDQISSPWDLSQQRPSADVDLAGPDEDDAECSSPAVNSPTSGSGKHIIRPTTGQAVLPSKRKTSHKNRQPETAALGPVQASKVSKAPGKKKGPQRRPNISQMLTSDSLPFTSGIDVAELQPLPSPSRVAPRRSKRVQAAVLDAFQEPTRTASTKPVQNTVRPKSERNVASSPLVGSSAKPQGIPKKQPAKITRRTGRGKPKN